MQDQGDNIVPRVLNKYRRLSRRKSPHRDAHYSPTKLYRQSYYVDTAQLEQLISDQNILIERLQVDLKNEKEIVKKLKQDEIIKGSLYLKQIQDIGSELNGLKELLFDNGIQEASQECFDAFKFKVEQDLRHAFTKTISDLKLNHRKEIEKLEYRYEEAVNRMVEGTCLKDSVLEKQLELLSNTVAKLNSTCNTLEDVWDPGHYQVEIEHLNKTLDAIRISEQKLSPAVSTLSHRLVESVNRETNIWKELHNFKLEYFQLREELNVLKKLKINESKSLANKNQFIDLEHSVAVCNHDKRINLASSKLLSEVERLKEFTAPDATNEMDSLLNYTKKLKKYLRDMVVFYNVRLNKFIGLDTNSSSFNLSLLEKGDVCVEAESGRLMTDIRECHRSIFYLNEILKSFDLNFDETQKKNKLIHETTTKLKSTHQEKVFSLDSQIKLLNEKIIVCLRENKCLESEIAQIRSNSISKEQYDLICLENKKMIDLNKKLEEELITLKKDNVTKAEVNKNTLQDTSKESGKDTSNKGVKMESLDCTDTSLVYEDLLPKNAITSTPFFSKSGEKIDLCSSIDLLKSSLLEWIERCQNIESEKKQLENKLFQLSFTFNQTEFTKKVLEQEINILRDNVKYLENKVADYVSLKEKCHILENDNSVLSIKLKFLSEIQDRSMREDNIDSANKECRSYVSFDLESLDSSVAKLNFIHEFQKKNQLIIHLESKCLAKDSLNDELSLKLYQAKEMEKIFENKINTLISDGNSVYEKLFSLIEENTLLHSEKRVSEIELKSVKDQLNYLISSGDVYKDYSSNELIEAMNNDALKFVKDSIEKWCKLEQKCIDTCLNCNQVERLDARHCLEILTKNNSLLTYNNEELLLKISKLQHLVHSLQKNQDIDEGWFLEMDSFKRELLKELKEQRDQHARIEEALRSTGNLHNELQKQCDLLRTKHMEISTLQTKLEEEKLEKKNSVDRCMLIESDLKEKEKILQEALDAKQACEIKLASMEKEFAQKEKKYQSDIMRTKWLSHYSQNKSVDSLVKRSIGSFQTELLVGLAERERNRYESMDVLYQHSIESLRYLLQQDKSTALIDLSDKHRKKIKDCVNLLMDQVSTIEDLEANKVLTAVGIAVEGHEKSNLSEMEANKDKINKELLEIEQSASQLPDNKIFTQFKNKLHEYFDLQFFLSISRLKEGHRRQSEIAFKALSELHSEEMMILKLKKEAEKNAALYNFTQDQLKREKNLINSLSQSEINSQNSVFNQFRVSVIKLFLKYVQMFIPAWEKMYNKDLEALEKKYQQYLNNYFNETTDNYIEMEVSKEIENIICNQSLIVDNSQNFVNKLDECLSHLLKSAHDFFKNNCEELTNAVKMINVSDCPEKLVTLHQKIKMLQLEKDELEEKHRAAVQLLVSDHEEELLKIRSLVEELNKTNSVEHNVAIDKLRFELDEKHSREVEELRTYFERKCAELEKHYSEEIFSHQSRKMSIISSSSESELVSEENSMDAPFHATLIVTDEYMSQIPEGTNLLTELYSDHDAENGLLVERYFVDLNAMDQVLLKHKIVVDRVVSFWKSRLDMLYSNLERKYSDRLESEFSGFKDTEERVQGMLADVKDDSLRELEWINSVQTANILEESLRLDVERQYESKISRIIDDYEDRLVKESSNLTQIYKKRELEAIWAAKVEAEQTYRHEIQSIESKWEKKYVSDMASFLSERTIHKVQFEEDIKCMLHSCNTMLSQKYNILEEKVKFQMKKLDELINDKIPALSEKNIADIGRIKELWNIEKDVMQKNCINRINQIELDAKQSCDSLISMYEKELTHLTQTHQEEMKVTLEKHDEEMTSIKERMKAMPVLNEDEICEKARELAINHVVERIVDYISKEGNSDCDGILEVNLPPEISGLESFFKSRYKKIIDEQATRHQEELEKLKQEYERQVNSLNKVTQENIDSDCSRSVNFSCQTSYAPDNSEELDKLIKERDALRKLTECLKSAVGQLSTYLHSCEDELNRTVVEQLLKAATSAENSPARGSSGGSLKRVHFAPDVSRILETSFHEDSSSADISCLEGLDVSSLLKHELDSCLTKLRTEATAILGLSVNNRTAPRPLPSFTLLSNMAKRLLSDKTSPSAADIINIVDELTLEGDRIIEQLQHEKEDLQQQITAADNQLRSTREFLEDQAVEREAERDEYSRELSLLQAHIKQSTPDNRHQTLAMQLTGFQQDHSSGAAQPIEDLEKQVTDTSSNLNDVETRKKELEEELKSTVEKVWVLTDIINKLEGQILVKSEREECLEKRLDELEAELEQQSLAQQVMVQEMESLKSREESENNYMEQIAALQEEMKLQYSSNSIRNIKSQLREIEKGIESRTKELEGLNLNSSTTSLSSPSEEISIREHLEMLRCQTPEFCPSPVALPVDEVNKLQDKIQRHIRSEEMIIKKVKDQDIQIKKLSQILSEVQAEREALQQTVEKLNGQLGRANTKVDDLRRKAETAHSSANKAILEKISILEEEVGHFKQNLEQAQCQLQIKDDQLKRAKELIDTQNVKLRNLSQSDPDVVNALRLELASVMTEKNKLEEMVEKFKNEAEVIDMSPLYSCLLNDKNEDIQQLQRTVSLLQSQTSQSIREKGGGDFGPSVIGKTVSFAEEFSPIGRSITPIRDAPRMHSFSLPVQVHETDKSIGLIGSLVGTHEFEPSLSPNNSMFNVTPITRAENEEKVSKLESEVKSLRSLVTDLTDAKKDVESYISSFTDDRKYYESQLNKLLDEKKSHEDEIEKLRHTLEKKDNEIQSTTADVNKLQVILGNLQEKLKQASKLASKENEVKQELSEMKEKCSTLEDALNRFYKFRDDLGTLNEDFVYRESSNYDYFQNILETLRQKLRKSTDIEMSNSNLKRQLDGFKDDISKIKQENDHLKNEICCKKEMYENEIFSMKSQIDEITRHNAKLQNENLNNLQLKQNNVDLTSKLEQSELSRNLMEVELNSLKSENNKLTEELECITTELKFKNINDYEEVNVEKDAVDNAPAPVENEHVADLEDLTYEIEKQLDLSAKLDNSLLNAFGDKPCCKKDAPVVSSIISKDSTAIPTASARIAENQTDQGLVNWLAKEVDAWQSASSKQNQLSSQLNNLSRLVQTQDNRITRLLIELDGKKKECLVMELDLLRERSNLKQAQCLLETERQRARAIQKEDTHLIETLRIRLEAALKAESSLKNLLLEERQKCEALEACLNSARALESYLQSSSDSESSQTVRNQLMVRIEVDRLKQMNNDLENVLSRERNSQSALKEKIKLLQIQNHSLEKQVDDLSLKLNEEAKLRESLANHLRDLDQNRNNSSLKLERDVGSKLAMESVLTEIKLWKDECLQLRECIRLQREHEDYWSANVQTPLIKQLNDVNRSLESMVREKVTLQTYVSCIEKERDFLRSRVEKLEEMNEKLSGSNLTLSPQISAKLNLQSVFNKLQYLAELNHKMESHRKALVWQKRYLLVAINGYQKTTAEAIDRFDPRTTHSKERRKFSFRVVVHVIRACIKLNYIHKRRKACRKILVNKMKAEINLPTTPKMIRKSSSEVLTTNNPNFMSLSPPSRDLYAVPRVAEPSRQNTMEPEPSKLSHYIAMFDQMQKRLGKIIQNENL